MVSLPQGSTKKIEINLFFFLLLFHDLLRFSLGCRTTRTTRTGTRSGSDRVRSGICVWISQEFLDLLNLLELEVDVAHERCDILERISECMWKASLGGNANLPTESRHVRDAC